MDTKFSIAVHVLILVSEAEKPLSSAQIAESVGTNPSFVRKVLSALKAAGLIDSHQGRAGFSLKVSSEKLSLFQIYQAIYGREDIELFEVHKNPNDQCVVGRFITPTLTNVFAHIQQETQGALASTTLADCMDDMRLRIANDDRTLNPR